MIHHKHCQVQRLERECESLKVAREKSMSDLESLRATARKEKLALRADLDSSQVNL